MKLITLLLLTWPAISAHTESKASEEREKAGAALEPARYIAKLKKQPRDRTRTDRESVADITMGTGEYVKTGSGRGYVVFTAHRTQKLNKTGTEYVVEDSQQTRRKPLSGVSSPAGSLDVVATLDIKKVFWSEGVRGQGVKTAIFDTGIAQSHPHFANAKIKTCSDFTNSGSCEDGFGHGSFVAGLIAAQTECIGMAPDSEMHIFKVFTDKQLSFTSWFLEAFNQAIDQEIDVINFSIGGPDYMDRPFVDKVREASANGITIVSAIGNDGPLYGTLNNPADQLDVIGVGGITHYRRLASFSSRGMTTWELPQGYGRIKPDVVTHSETVRSTSHKGGCKSLSGTSVASPIVTGIVTELIGLARSLNIEPNPAYLKQILTSTSRKIADTTVYAQGSGMVSVAEAAEAVRSKQAMAPSFIPHSLILHDCHLFWPHCHHPLYHTSSPVVVNLTVANPVSVQSRIMSTVWLPSKGPKGLLTVGTEYSDVVWPWSGWLSVSLSVGQATNFTGIVEGEVQATLEAKGLMYTFSLFVSVKVIARPPRHRRILWDVFHNMQYPPAYVARDDLQVTSDVLDWNGDHPHTNFREAFNNLVLNGWHVDLLTDSFTMFEAKNYVCLLLIDTEEEFSQEEKIKLQHDVSHNGLALLVFAEWYNTDLMKNARFVDDNTQEMWTPVVGGGNLPALNELLEPFSAAFSSSVFQGAAKISDSMTFRYASGTSIAKFPKNGMLFHTSAPLTDLTDPAKQPRKRSRQNSKNNFKQSPQKDAVPVLGITGWNSGVKLALFGDSGCLDSAHSGQQYCFHLLQSLVKWAGTGRIDAGLLASRTRRNLSSQWDDASVALPSRIGPALLESHSLHGPNDRRDASHRPKVIAGIKPILNHAVTVSNATRIPPAPIRSPVFLGEVVTVPPSRDFYTHYVAVALPVAGLTAVLMLWKFGRRRRPARRL